MWVIFKIQGIIQMCIFVWNTQPTSNTLLSSIDQNIYCIQLDICFSPAKVRSQIEAASPGPAQPPAPGARLRSPWAWPASGVARLGPWWCGDVFNIFWTCLNETLIKVWIWLDVSRSPPHPRPPSPPTHPSLTQHTAILYCTEQCQPWRKNWKTLWRFLYCFIYLLL